MALPLLFSYPTKGNSVIHGNIIPNLRSLSNNHTKAEAKVIRERDPAIKSNLEIILYPGFRAVLYYRLAHKLYLRKHSPDYRKESHICWECHNIAAHCSPHPHPVHRWEASSQKSLESNIGAGDSSESHADTENITSMESQSEEDQTMESGT